MDFTATWDGLDSHLLSMTGTTAGFLKIGALWVAKEIRK